MAKPLLLLSFANEKEPILTKLKEESRSLNSAFMRQEREGSIRVLRDESTTLASLSDYLINYNNQIEIFHFAGHANAQNLMFEGGPSYSSGLAGLLAAQSNLKLVFLNGCATLEQAKLLLENGVKAVIATSLPIDDGKAKAFSENFYKSLSANLTVQAAFNHAVNFMKASYADYSTASAQNITVFRSTGFMGEGEEIPWQLLVHEDYTDEVLQWRLFSNARLPNEKHPTKFFLMYDTENTREVEKLKKFLYLMERNREIELFDMHSSIPLSGDLEVHINKNLDSTDYVLCLLTFNFIPTTYHLAEAARNQFKKPVIPIYINEIDKRSTFFPSIKGLPLNGVPIEDWINEDKAYVEIVRELRRLLGKN